MIWVVHLDRIYKMKKEHNAMLNSGGRLASRSDGNPDARHPFWGQQEVANYYATRLKQE